MKTKEAQKLFEVNQNGEEFDVQLDGRLLFKHSPAKPFIFVGSGEETIDMYRGNFKIKDYVVERVALRYATVRHEGETCRISFRHFSHDHELLTMVLKKMEKVCGFHSNSLTPSSIVSGYVSRQMQKRKFMVVESSYLTSTCVERTFRFGHQSRVLVVTSLRTPHGKQT